MEAPDHIKCTLRAWTIHRKSDKSQLNNYLEHGQDLLCRFSDLLDISTPVLAASLAKICLDHEVDIYKKACASYAKMTLSCVSLY